MEIVKKGKIKALVSDKIDAVHAFTLREGGVSGGEYACLNVGLRRGDNPFDVFKNLEICCDSLGLCKENLTLTNQLHTDNVRFLCKEDVGKGLVKEWKDGVDAIVTDCENVPLMCYSADCVPVLLCETGGKIVGAVHSGWRGTAENIVKNTVFVMEEHGADKEKICAFIGPAIGMCCYEVSEDVAEKFERYGECVRRKENGKYMLDLKNIVKNQLTESGIKEENIDVAPFCTSCDNDKFFSHRRQNGKSGLLGGFIQKRAKGTDCR